MTAGKRLTDERRQERADRAFAAIERAAVEGKRCPDNGTTDIPNSDVVGELVRAGRIRTEIYDRNYRVIVLLTGEHAGKHTLPPPSGRPWRIIDAAGSRTPTVNGRRFGKHHAKVQPSAPRFLTKEELR